MPKKTNKSTDPILKLTDMTAAELTAKIKDLAGQIQKRKLETAVGRNRNVREVFNLRHELARIKTVLNIKK